MLKTNLKLAIRNIFRNKLYTAINVIGLGVASAFCILVYLYVKNEQSFDSFHASNDRLFRLEQTNVFSAFDKEKPKKSFFSLLMKNEEQKNMIITPVAFAPDIKSNFPEVENAVRIAELQDPVIRIDNQSFKEKNENVVYADADFFSAFSFPLISGEPANVLRGQKQVVISEKLAKKYFGSTNVIGKALNITSDKLLLTISGVAKDFPANSSFKFDIVIPRIADPYYSDELKRGTNSFNDLLMIRLVKGTNVNAFQKKLDAFSTRYFKTLTESMAKQDPKNKPENFHVYLRPFAEAHYNQSENWNHYTDLKNIYQLVCLAIIILFIACLNYILLTLTNAISRSQDVGVRKTIGAGRRQIILQYYTETQLLAFIAVIVGLLISFICLPFFSSLTGSAFNLSNFSVIDIAALLFTLAIILGLLAGVYPALAMSGLRPLNIMRGFSAYKINPVLSKSLIVVQFSICVILVISTLAINKQMHFISNADMGFDKDQVVVLANPYGWDEGQKAAAFKNQMYHFVSTEPNLQDITTTTFGFEQYGQNGHLINGKPVPIQSIGADYNYFAFNKIPIIKGRAFSHDIVSDTARLQLTAEQKTPHSSSVGRSVVVNETLYNMLGKPEMGQVNPSLGALIIGVCKDFHNDDLTKAIAPVYIKAYPNVYKYFRVKIKAGHSIPNAMANIKSNWNKLTGNLPFSYTFLDEDVAKSYDAYMRWMTTITVSCILAIIIACLGLFGLSGLTTLNRTKEIGIRKVLGASVSNLFLLLNSGTILLACGSFIIAAPLAYYLVHQWLDNFTYRITPDWTLFVVAGIIAMLTAIIAVSYHTIKAAISNPVKSLRSE
ncbi:MAG: ABC transporter permease [Bacteroidota bacterium]|nr:ABC transporter permease [Bacteroidota bacterium]